MCNLILSKEYSARIDSISSDGSGVCRINGMAVFVPFTAPGDTVRVKITSVKKRFASGIVTGIISPSPLRADPACIHYHKCGGCRLRHIKYDEQLNIKKSVVENSMRRIGGFKDFSLDEITGMDTPSHYRNKMVFRYVTNSGKTVSGLYNSSSHDVVSVPQCTIGAEENRRITEAVLLYMDENSVSAYDEHSGEGIIRRVFIRRSYSSKEIMVVISIRGKTLPDTDTLVSLILKSCGQVASIILEADAKSDTVISDKTSVLYGKASITDHILGIKFEISPQSFFQVNPLQTEKLYLKVLEFAGIDSSTRVLDIYCGIGTISLCAAKQAKHVTGIEAVSRAVRDAKANARQNNINNTSFYAGDASVIVPEIIKKGVSPDVVILDPPRKGSSKRTLSAIAKATPARIVYVSCNSATLARDTRFLADNGFRIIRSAAIDMFPHTHHAETVCLLSKLKSSEHIEVELNMDELDLTAAEKKATYREIQDYVLEHYGLKVSPLNIAQVKRKCGIIERENYNKPKNKDSKQPQCTPEKESAVMDALRHFGMIKQ